jgi:hypothetical protein
MPSAPDISATLGMIQETAARLSQLAGSDVGGA